MAELSATSFIEDYRGIVIVSDGKRFSWEYAGTRGSTGTLKEARIQIDGMKDYAGLIVPGRDSVTTSAKNILRFAKGIKEAGKGLRFIQRVFDDMKELVRDNEILISEELIDSLIKEAKYEETKDSRQVTMWVHENYWMKDIISDGRYYYCHIGGLSLKCKDLDIIKKAIHHIEDYSGLVNHSCKNRLERNAAEKEVRRLHEIFDTMRDAVNGGNFEGSDR